MSVTWSIRLADRPVIVVNTPDGEWEVADGKAWDTWDRIMERYRQ